MNSLATAVALILITVACASSAQPAKRWTADDERAIRAADSSFVAAWLRDDTSAVMRTLAADAVLMPTGQYPLATPNDIRAFWWPTDGSHTRILAFQRTIDELAGEGDVAWVRGTDSLTWSYANGKTTSQRGNRSMTLAVWRRQADGSWRMSRAMWGTRTR